MRNRSLAEVGPLPSDGEPTGKHCYLQMYFHSEFSEVRFIQKRIHLAFGHLTSNSGYYYE